MKKTGSRSIVFENGVGIVSRAAIAGQKEKEGPLGESFDETFSDDLLGQNTWEKAESEMLRRTIVLCAKKAGKNANDIGALLAGDLNAQIISSGFAARELGVPFIGMYGACSTMTEGLMTGACLVDGGAVDNAVCAASSHFCTAERQFRTPLELGSQRPPSAQWTAMAAGAIMLSKTKDAKAYVTHGTIGRVIDMKIKDANQMGAAMAPAVMDTMLGHMEDTGRKFSEYDLIVTGDLGLIGREILKELLSRKTGKQFDNEIFDCGAQMYSNDQDTHAGGSGCGCIASILSGYILNEIEKGKYRRILALGSGAMLSLASTLQGESIPSVSYAVSIERRD